MLINGATVGKLVIIELIFRLVVLLKVRLRRMLINQRLIKVAATVCPAVIAHGAG